MIYLILGILAVLCGVGAIGSIIVDGRKKEKAKTDGREPKEEEDWNSYDVMFVVCLAAVIMGSAIIFPWQVSNGRGLAEWQAFCEANTYNYEYAVDETVSYLSVKDFTGVMVEGSIEKLEQAGYVSERIREWRNAVNQYNTTIASMKYYNRNILTGVLVPDGIEDMRLLIIK